ncbi:Ubiquitin [Cordyceps militaris CM01]|uniref:Ubiquitin n=1 Tax=Cordyceps militaris (strain CM01) TaxID=983644 RepID=G3JDP6_CORMM|nr:Ubiquitin [Cordyceps militaris CM01]EGX92721.1 Ubiquitin [Cordyceps militaris CM01]
MSAAATSETASIKATGALAPAAGAIAASTDSVPLESIRRSTEATSSAQHVAPDNGPGPDAIDTTNMPEQTSAASASTSAPEVPVKAGNGVEKGPEPPAKEVDDAIGPAQEHINSGASTEPGAPPVCNITLLLTSGTRHPYRLDAKYLSRRNVVMPDETEHGHPDPFSISIYTLKELILREWRSDWEPKPASPSSIRLIHFGKLLDDKEQLRKYQFSQEAPNVVHMSIRPQDLDEEETKPGGKSLGAGSGDGSRSRSGGSCCVIL